MAQKSFLSVNERIDALALLGQRLRNITPDDEAAFQHAYHKNNWFTRDNVDRALRNIADEFLDKDKLNAFAGKYNLFQRDVAAKTIGLVFAGNIPLVGFHDWLCVVLCGHNALVKLSSKDDVLFPFVLNELHRIEPRFASQTTIAEQLKNFDAVIATGSNNSARYFEHYFGKYPHIIRRNRSAVAVVDERTTPAELELLADDVFAYFGLGCRNVSKLYLHQGVSIDTVLQHFDKYKHVLDHNKYRNNYDYRYTIVIMNQQPHHTNGSVLAVPDEAISTPLSILHYEQYDSREALNQKLEQHKEEIQAIVGHGFIPFGHAQTPSLTEYADGVDVMEFLLQLD